ncbi:hypothetical protein VTL71DRAFT_14628 [Oculimacula yallundae]|uniref:Uncharacterized protein n=1 Tax=Oculimacula yallundae TaxID=86028 RepID=A0ABR4CJ07_9HELO
MYEAMLSSPDPLNDSPAYQSPAKTRRSSRARRSLPLQGSSPKKQTFELDVGNSLSPQKIRVTVEAGESDVENAYPVFNGTSASPTRMPRNRRRERTTTTTVPVKGLSDSEPEAPQAATPKRGRGRPRKSIGTPVPAKKPGRASTPTQKNRRKSIGSLVDGDDEEDANFQIGNGVEIGRGKGKSKSRSRSTKGRRTSIPAAKNTTTVPDPGSGVAIKKGKGRPKASAREEIDVLEDESCRGNTEDQEQGFGDYENDEALEAIDANSQTHASPYSTIRSTTTIGGSQSDVVIARFDPGDETPRRPGWSSPHTVEAPHPSSSRHRADTYPPPSVSPAKVTSEDHDVETVASPNSLRQGSVRSDDDGDEQYNEEEEEIEQYRDFDTILESEGFSMISVDSVPSLREHFSSPANQPEKQLSSQIKKKSLLSMREAAAYDDSFSAIPEGVLEAATPMRKPQNPRLLSVQKVRADDTFSRIPPEVLQAATPAQKSQISRLISQNTPGNDSFSSVAPEILEAATPHRKSPNKMLSAVTLGINDQYEDSFSAVPADILDAATPAATRHLRPTLDRLSVPINRSIVPPSQTTQTTDPVPTRLLTPEETPSPPADDSNDLLPQSNRNTSSQPAGQASTQVSGQESSLIHSHMPSSPPSIAPRRYTYTAHLRQNLQLNKSLAQTPSIVFSSPALPPPIQFGRGMPTLAPLSEQAQRPLLSPTVRAGRMLQDILVPSSSSRSRSQSLGSPFKSPAADRRSSSILAQGSYPSPVCERLAGPLPRLDLSDHFGESSSQRPSRSSQQDDPFRNSATTQQRSPSPEEKQQYTLELPQQRRFSDPRLLNTKSEPQTLRSDDAMSWQAEEEVAARDSVTLSCTDGDLNAKSGDLIRTELPAEQRWAAERAVVVQEAANANTSQVIVIDSDDEHPRDGQDEDEDFGLLLETLNSSSPVVEAREAPKENFERPRRSKLPSPWRKNSKRLVYSDEVSHMPSSPPEATIQTMKALGKQTTTDPITVRRFVPEEPSDETDIDLSQYQIPQKANFNPRPRKTGNLDLSALLGTSPPKPASEHSIFQRQSRPKSGTSNELHKEQPTTKKDEQKLDEPVDFKPIPQKMGFNPRPRATSIAKTSSNVPSLFGSSAKPNQTIKFPELSSSPMPLTTASPSRLNSIRADLTPAEVSTSGCSMDSRSSNADKENQVSANSRTLKWTEALRLDTSATANVVLPAPVSSAPSPTKSCLRSPLKTPTTSSGFGYGTTNLSPSKGVTFVSSSPTPESPDELPLSATTWSKDHWRVLDEILQTWKPENNDLPLATDGKESSARRRRNSTRVISRLLGKTVFSGNEKMKLEQWHLETVDEFRGCVPGWQEKVVAMRLFALLVGEEKRAKGFAGGGKAGNYDHLN